MDQPPLRGVFMVATASSGSCVPFDSSSTCFLALSRFSSAAVNTRAPFLPLPVDARQVFTGLRLDARCLRHVRQKLLVAATVVTSHNRLHRRVRFQGRRVDPNGPDAPRVRSALTSLKSSKGRRRLAQPCPGRHAGSRNLPHATRYPARCRFFRSSPAAHTEGTAGPSLVAPSALRRPSRKVLAKKGFKYAEKHPDTLERVRMPSGLFPQAAILGSQPRVSHMQRQSECGGGLLYARPTVAVSICEGSIVLEDLHTDGHSIDRSGCYCLSFPEVLGVN